MKNNGWPLNPFQSVLAIAKIVLLVVLPVIGFGYLGFMLPFGFTGYRLMNAGNVLIYIPLLIYVLMLVCSFGSLQKFSWGIGILGLVSEVALMNMSGVMLQQGDVGTLIQLALSAIPADIVPGVTLTKDVIIQSLAKPGLAWTLNLILSIVYIIAYFLMGFIEGAMNGSGFGRSGGSSGTIEGSTGGINRNNPRL